MLPSSKLFLSRALNTRTASRTAAWASLTLASALLLAACGGSSSGGSAAPVSVGLHGAVHGGRQPVVGARIQIYEAGLNPGDAPEQIGNTTTAGDGTWNVATLSPTPANGQLVYVVALAGQPTPGVTNTDVELMTVAGAWGSSSFPATVNITELSTVASVSVLQNYITEVQCGTIKNTDINSDTTGIPLYCPSIAGATSLVAHAATLASLVNVVNGQASTFLTSASEGPINTTLQNLNFQASVLASCINSNGGVSGDGGACGNLFAATRSTGEGDLVASTSVADSNDPSSAAVSPNGQFLYVTDSINNAISVWSLTPGTGAVSSSPVASIASTDVSPVGVAISPDGAHLFVSDSSGIGSYSIDSTTGALTAGPHVVDGNAPDGLAVTPDGTHLYVGDSNSSDIALYSIDSSTGALTAGTITTDGGAPDGMVVSPDGTYLYVANEGSGNIGVYTVTAGTGALTLVTNVPEASNPEGMAISPDGAFLFVADANGDVSNWAIDASTHQPSLVTAVNDFNSPSAVAVSPDGAYAYVTDQATGISVYSIDNGTADTLKSSLVVAGNPAKSSVVSGLFALSPLPAVYNPIPSAAPSSWVVSSGGSFAYVADQAGNDISVWSVNSSTGALSSSPISSVGDGNGPTALAVSPNGEYLFVADSGDISVWSIDPATGAVSGSALSSVPDLNTPFGLTVSADGQYLYVADSTTGISVLSINSSTGALTTTSNLSATDANHPFGVALSPDGQHLFVADFTSDVLSVWGITSGTEAVSSTPGSSSTDSNAPTAVAVAPNGNYLYAADESDDISVWGITPGTGVLSNVPLSSASIPGVSTGLAVAPNGAWLYAIDEGTQQIAVYSISSSDGSLSGASTINDSQGPYGIAISP